MRPPSPSAMLCRAAFLTAGALILSLAAKPAAAQISFVNMFRNDSSVQTGNGPTLSTLGSFFSSDLVSTNPGDFGAVSMTYPGPGSPVGLPQITSTDYHYQTGLLPDQATMDAAFPTGTYSYDATGGTMGPQTTSYTYASDHYPLSEPYLTGSDYSNLQGMNATTAFTYDFSPDTTGTADFSYIFFTLFDDTTSAFVYDAGFLPPTTTSVTVPGGTLTPGHTYTYELDFSNRILTASPGATFQAQIGYDLRTDGIFRTLAVPEPGAPALLVAGCLAGAGCLLRRRRA